MVAEKNNKKQSKDYETFLGKEISEHLSSVSSEPLHQKSRTDTESKKSGQKRY